MDNGHSEAFADLDRFLEINDLECNVMHAFAIGIQ